MLIEITQDDIDNARHSYRDCPIGQWIQRNFKTKFWAVSSFGILIDEDKYYSDDMRNFVMRYDTRQKIEPTSFEVDKV